jgi:hypothetical protein
MKFPSLTIDQKIIAIILLTLIVVGAALGADYQALWLRDKDWWCSLGRRGVRRECLIGVEREGGRGMERRMRK